MKLYFKFTVAELWGTFRGPLAFNKETGELQRFADRDVAERYVRAGSVWIPIEIKKL